VLGGSTAFGQGLPSDVLTFASLLGPKIDHRVVNAAVIGYLSGQELGQMVHYVDDLSPRLYVVVDGWNEILSPYAFTTTWPVQHPPIGFNETFLSLEKTIAHCYREKSKDDPPAEHMPPFGAPLDERQYFEEIVRRYESNLERMFRFAQARGARFLVVFQPEVSEKKHLTDHEREALSEWERVHQYRTRRMPERFRALVDRASDFCAKNGIPFVDVGSSPAFVESRSTLFYDVVHPNEEGHAVIANVIAGALLTPPR
jgi:lysophospholipase L1-like esterase